jgi:AraC-like DNA-binding protein
MFFESYHSTEHNFFKILENETDPGFSLHIHKSYECYAVTKGCARATVDGKEYTLFPGEAVLVFPYQSHEYKTDSNTGTWVCIFSPDLVESYEKQNGFIPKDSKFRFEANGTANPKSLLMKKSLCYNICGVFDEGRKYVKTDSAEMSLISKLLLFISENYRSECTLQMATQSVGYDYNYISKLFKRTVKISFNSYVNQLRIHEACRLLASTDLSVQEVAETCGYSCTRTFHREFFKIMRVTPKEYRG